MGGHKYPDEVEYITNLSFTPLSPIGMRGFDPAETSELFERPVSPPDFRSPKYRFLVGPFRWFATRIFSVISLIHDKLTEHKIQAFYNIVHEIIAINHRSNNLKEKFESVLEENLRLRMQLEATDPSRASEGRVALPAAVPDLPPTVHKANEAAVEHLLKEYPDLRKGTVLVLDDFWGHLGFELHMKGFRNLTLSSADSMQALYAREVRRLAASSGNAITVLNSMADASCDLIFHADAGRVTGQADLLFSLSARKLKSGGLFFFRFVTGIKESPFRMRPLYDLDSDLLRKSLEDSGLKIVEERATTSFADGSLELICRKL